MKLSTRGQYALHAMIFLARKAGEGPQSLKTIAEDGLPEQYLEQLLGALRRSAALGIIWSLTLVVTAIIVFDVVPWLRGDAPWPDPPEPPPGPPEPPIDHVRH